LTMAPAWRGISGTARSVTMPAILANMRSLASCQL
jgi:hypothetical protein